MEKDEKELMLLMLFNYVSLCVIRPGTTHLTSQRRYGLLEIVMFS